jgi:hypothetical protein
MNWTIKDETAYKPNVHTARHFNDNMSLKLVFQPSAIL